MDASRAMALLVGKGLKHSSGLLEKLRTHQWECMFAASYAEAHTQLNAGRFGLLLSEYYLPDGSACRLIPWLEGSETTVYFSFQTGTLTWWLPAVDRGQPCFGTAALRAAEFGRKLEESLKEETWLSEREYFVPARAIHSFRISIALPLDYPERPRQSENERDLISIRRKGGKRAIGLTE